MVQKQALACTAFRQPLFSLLVFTVFLFVPASSIAQQRNITFVVPLAAGGPADLVGRIIAQRMSEDSGEQVIVENIGGGSGQIALNKVARAKPDGTTLLFTVGSFLTVVPHLYPKADLDPHNLFAPVAMLTAFPTMLVSSSKLPTPDLKSFLAYAYANPDKLNFASPGAGSNPHLAAEAIKRKLGFNAAHVPYRGGGPALAAVMAGDVDFACTEPSNLLAQMDSGKLRALAVADSKRHAAFPDVPSFAELGYSDLEFRAWTAVLAPAGTSKTVIERLEKRLRAAVQSPDVMRRKIDAVFSGPQVLSQVIKRESAQWRPLIEGLGLAQE